MLWPDETSTGGGPVTFRETIGRDLPAGVRAIDRVAGAAGTGADIPVVPRSVSRWSSQYAGYTTHPAW